MFFGSTKFRIGQLKKDSQLNTLHTRILSCKLPNVKHDSPVLSLSGLFSWYFRKKALKKSVLRYNIDKSSFLSAEITRNGFEGLWLLVEPRNWKR